MNEINKPNDIFVSTLVNGVLNPQELLAHDITADNTGFLSPEQYKESKFVQKAFTDDKGVFNNEAFENAYLTAAQSYSDLANAKTYKNLENYIEYNLNDIFAPLGSKKSSLEYEINKEINPERLSQGVTSLFGKGEAYLSKRELAQLSLIYDTETGKFLDLTAEDRSLLGSIFGNSLVYATWDSDGVHEDPITKRQIKHRKGEWKLNDQGQYYTETIGNRSGAGKEFVAVEDTLTKEDSWLNKYDFFDSDGLSKSAVGTTFKTFAKIVPYLFPGMREVWGATTAAVELAGVMPTFAKVLEGIAAGDDADYESSFTKAMNRWENYFKKYDNSYSDDALNSMFGYQQIADTVSSVFAQLYQMRAAASISKLVKSDPTNQAIEKFLTKFLPQFIEANGLSGLTSKEFREVSLIAASKLPEVKAAIEAQSKLSKSLSLGYMALTSSADVYLDALNGGYDRRTAGFAALAAVAGQYGIMMNNRMGDWFLDATTGYSNEINRSTMIKALRPHYDEILKGVQKLPKQTTTQGKMQVVGGVFNKIGKGIKKVFGDAIDSSESYWKNAIIEGVEEMTEEAVMDATKGVFDFLSWAGIGKNPNATFGTLENFRSGEFVSRYLQNALGGFLGGALFEFQGKKIEPWMNSLIYGKPIEKIQPSLIHEIANGNTEELIRIADELGELDGEIASGSIKVGNKDIEFTAGNNQLTRGLVAANTLKNYIRHLEGILIDEKANLSDELVLQKAIRDHRAIKLLEEGSISKIVVNDFTKLTSDIATIVDILNERNKDKTPEEVKEEETKAKTKESKDENKKEDKKEESSEASSDYANLSTDELYQELDSKRKELQAFISGENGEKYLKKSLAYLIPEIRAAVGGLSKYEYTYFKYNKNYSELSKDKGPLNLKKIDEEYKEWKDNTNAEEKFLTLGIESYDDFRKKFTESILLEAKEGYADVRSIVFANVLSPINGNTEELIKEEAGYNMIKTIANTLKENGLDGVTLEDVFGLDNLKLTKAITLIVDESPLFVKTLQATGKSKSQIIESLTSNLALILQRMNVEDLLGNALGDIIKGEADVLLEDAFNSFMEKHPNITLQDMINIFINNNDITPEEVNAYNISEEELQSSNPLILSAFYKSFVRPRLDITKDYNIGLSSSLLFNYLENEKVLDGEIVLRVAKLALNRLKHKVNSINSILTDSPIQGTILFTSDMSDKILGKKITLSEDSIKKLHDLLDLNFSIKSLEDILDEWLLGENGIIHTDEFFKFFKKIEQEDYVKFLPDDTSIVKNLENITPETYANYIKNQFLNFIKHDYILNNYKSIQSKLTKQNRIYESLRKIDLILSEGEPSKVLELLDALHNKIRRVETFEDYLPLGIEKEQLENALLDINLYKAVIIGMRNTPMDYVNPFNYNLQLERFCKKYGIKTSEDYSTIDNNVIEVMLKDLDLIADKIKSYLEIANYAYTTKSKLDDNVRLQYSKNLLDFILDKGSKLNIKGISIIPSRLELDKYTTDESKLHFISHYLFNKYKEIKSAEGRKEFLSDFINGLELNLEELNDRNASPSNLDGDLKTINSNDVLNWVATSLSLDSFEFLTKYNKYIIKNENNPNVPLFSLELVILQVLAFANDEANVKSSKGNLISTHSAILEVLESLFNKDKEFLITPNLYFVNGITGAGKSSAIGSAISTLSDGKILYVSAPNEILLTKYTEYIKQENLLPELVLSGLPMEFLKKILTLEGINTLNYLIELLNSVKTADYKLLKDPLFEEVQLKNSYILYKLNPKNLEKYIRKQLLVGTLPEIVLIDETTHISLPVLLVMNYLGDKFNIKFILSGDSIQKGATFVKDPMAFKDLYMWKSPKLNISIRSSNSLKGNNNKNFSKALLEYENLTAKYGGDSKTIINEYLKYFEDPNNDVIISYYETDSKLVGDKFVDSLENNIDSIKKLLALSREDNAKDPEHKKRIGIITKLDEHNNPINTKLEAILKLTGFTSDDYILYSSDNTHPKAVQGAEADYFIIDGSYDWSSNFGENLRSIYTYASRSLKGSIIECSKERLASIHVRNQLDKHTQIDEIPQLLNRQELKKSRGELLDKILEGTTYDITPKKIKTLKVDDKEVPIRENSKVSSTSSKSESKTETKSQKLTITVDDAEPAEKTLSEELNQVIIKAMSEDPEIPAANTIDAANMTLVDGESQSLVNPKNTPDMVWGRPAVDHLGIKISDNGFGISLNTGINFDLDGLTQPQRGINPIVRTGFLRFKNLVSLADNREDIIEGIRQDVYIAAFFAEIVQYPWMSAVRNGEYEDTTLNPGKCDVMADWAEDHLSNDENDYLIRIFAKPYDPEVDMPTTMAGASLDKAVKPGETVLYYGFKLTSIIPQNEINNTFALNQWISLGSLPSKTYIDKNGEVLEWRLQAFKDLYKKADDALNQTGTTLKPFAVFETNTKVWDLKAASRLHFALKEETFYETLFLAERRGIIIDRDNVYMIDDSKVEFNGKEEYKALVMIAALDAEVVNNLSSDSKFGSISLHYTFEERLERLKQFFVYTDENGNEKLSIAGKYLAFAKVSPAGNTAKAFRRVVFLNGGKNDPKDVIKDTRYTVKTEVADWSWFNKLSKARSFSLTLLIIDLLNHVGAFKNNNELYKYCLYLKQTYFKLKGDKSNFLEKTTLLELVDWVKENLNGNLITPEDFKLKLNELGHRTLLMPFSVAFIGKKDSTYVMRSLDNFSIKNDNNEDYIIVNKDTCKLVAIDFDRLHSCYTCLPFVTNDTEVDFVTKFNLSTDTYPEDTFKFLRVLMNDDFAKLIGFNGFLLLSPTFVISKDMLLEILDALESPLLELMNPEQRFLRTTIAELPTKPKDFNPELYSPKKLSIKDYIVDSSFDKYAIYEDKKVKTTKWNPKKKKRVTTYKTVKHFKKYAYTKDDKGRRPPISITLDNGFELRIGDVVQLYGDETQTFRISGVNYENKLITLSEIGDSFGNQLSSLGGNRVIEGSAVTKVVKRTISSKNADKKSTSEEITSDYYYKGVWKTADPLENPIYKNVYKRFEIFLKYLKDFNDDAFDYKKFSYLFVPITTDNVDRLKHPLRDSKDGTLQGLIEFEEENPNAPRSYIVTSAEDLNLALLYYENLNENESSNLIGFTVYSVLNAYTTPEGVKVGRSELLRFQLTDDFYRAIIENERDSSRKSWIKHQVFFYTEDEFKLYKLEILQAEESKILYRPIEIAKQFKTPEVKIKSKEEGYYEIDYDSYKNKKSSEFDPKYFYIEYIFEKNTNNISKVRFYPKKAFYTDASISKELISFNLTTTEEKVTTYSDYTNFIFKHSDPTAISFNAETAKQFEDYLTKTLFTGNIVVVDYLKRSTKPLQEVVKEDSKDKKTKKKKESEEKFSVINKGNSERRLYFSRVILDESNTLKLVFYVNNNLEHVITYTAEDFLINLGSRFDLKEINPVEGNTFIKILPINTSEGKQPQDLDENSKESGSSGLDTKTPGLDIKSKTDELIDSSTSIKEDLKISIKSYFNERNNPDDVQDLAKFLISISIEDIKSAIQFKMAFDFYKRVFTDLNDLNLEKTPQELLGLLAEILSNIDPNTNAKFYLSYVENSKLSFENIVLATNTDRNTIIDIECNNSSKSSSNKNSSILKPVQSDLIDELP